MVIHFDSFSPSLSVPGFRFESWLLTHDNSVCRLSHEWVPLTHMNIDHILFASLFLRPFQSFSIVSIANAVQLRMTKGTGCIFRCACNFHLTWSNSLPFRCQSPPVNGGMNHIDVKAQCMANMFDSSVAMESNLFSGMCSLVFPTIHFRANPVIVCMCVYHFTECTLHIVNLSWSIRVKERKRNIKRCGCTSHICISYPPKRRNSFTFHSILCNSMLLRLRCIEIETFAFGAGASFYHFSGHSIGTKIISHRKMFGD